MQKVQRYSFQRPFSEVYRLAPGYDRWRSDPAATLGEAKVSAQPRARRCCPAALIIPITPSASRRGSSPRARSRTGLKVDQPWKDRSLTGIGPKLGGYPEKDLETIPSLELQTIANATNHPVNQPWAPGESQVLKSNAWQIVDFGCNLTGFIGAKVTCRSKTRLFLTFDEILSNGDVDFKRLGCVNIIAYELAAGHLRAGILRALHAALPEAHRARRRLRGAEPLSARIRRRRRLAGAVRRQR